MNDIWDEKPLDGHFSPDARAWLERLKNEYDALKEKAGKWDRYDGGRFTVIVAPLGDEIYD